jgi:hypothetical protein
LPLRVDRASALGDAILKWNRAAVGLLEDLVELAIEPARRLVGLVGR